MEGVVVAGRESIVNQANNRTKVDTTYPCECGEGYFQLRGGSKGEFYGCSVYPGCKETRKAEDGKPVKKKPEVEETICPGCHSGILVERVVRHGVNTGKKFNGCSHYPTCKHFQLLEQ